jgi:hypothetical protein
MVPIFRLGFFRLILAASAKNEQGSEKLGDISFWKMN